MGNATIVASKGVIQIRPCEAGGLIIQLLYSSERIAKIKITPGFH